MWRDDVTSICHCERSPFDSLRSLRVNSAESRNLINYFKLWITQISLMSFRGSRPPSRSFMRRSGGISRRLFNRGLCGRRLARPVNYYEILLSSRAAIYQCCASSKQRISPVKNRATISAKASLGQVTRVLNDRNTTPVLLRSRPLDSAPPRLSGGPERKEPVRACRKYTLLVL